MTTGLNIAHPLARLGGLSGLPTPHPRHRWDLWHWSLQGLWSSIAGGIHKGCQTIIRAVVIRRSAYEHLRLITQAPTGAKDKHPNTQPMLCTVQEAGISIQVVYEEESWQTIALDEAMWYARTWHSVYNTIEAETVVNSWIVKDSFFYERKGCNEQREA